MEIIKVTLAQAVALIEKGKTSGKFFSTTFIKRTNGEIRTMVCRGNVTKHLKGGELAFSPKEKNLVVVWDASVEDNTKAYRMINLDTILKVTLNGTIYEVIR